MPQIVKFIDVSRGFAVVDPDAYAENLGFTVNEDSPEKSPPILAFSGYNFLPTSYGYKSFFGTNSTLDISNLPVHCSQIIRYQFANYQNILIALCEDGIYIARPTETGAIWVRYDISEWVYQDWLGGRGFTTAGDSGSLENGIDNRLWTTAVLSNVLYIYRAGYPAVAKIGPLDIVDNVVTVTAMTPTFLNMQGQMGIFSANGRLGFWDSANSISWSSLFDPMDHTPALETLVGNAIFNDVLGKIVMVLPQGDGFIIYTTRGIVGVRPGSVTVTPWEANAISNVAGIAYPFQVVSGGLNSEHFAYTSTGIYKIERYSITAQTNKMESVITDVYDILKESREPVHLSFINGRFLFFSLLSSKYVTGAVKFNLETVGDVTVRILVNGGAWDGIELLPIAVDSRGYSAEVYVPGDIIPPGYSTDAPTGDYTQSVTSNMASQIGSGDLNGLYTKWSGTGKAMFSVARNQANITPYNRDSYSNHVRNTPIDTSVTIPPEITTIEDLTAAHLDSFTPANTPVDLEGGWIYPGRGRVDSSVVGNLDIHAKEMAITQMAEWDTFISVIQANHTALSNLSVGGSTVEVGSLYPTSQDAINAKEALIAAALAADPTATRQGDTVVTTEFVRDVPGTSSISTTPTLTGRGTQHASYSLRRNWIGGTRLTKKVYETYSVGSRPLSPPPGQYAWKSYFTNQLGVYNHFPITGTIINYAANSAAALEAATTAFLSSLQIPSVYYRPDWDTTTVSDLTPQAIVSNTRYIDGHVVTVNWQGTTTADAINHVYYGTVTTPTGVQDNYVQKTTSYSLDSSDAPGFTFESEMLLNQKVLEWGTEPPTDLGPRYLPSDPTYRFGPGSIRTFNNIQGAYTVPGVSIPGGVYPGWLDVTYPGATFLFQDGDIAPVYPTFVGALVLDTALKKWGKLKNDYKVLFDMTPINTTVPYVPFSNFGMDIGLLLADKSIKMADDLPVDSKITYGKIGYYRAGVIHAQEVIVHFKTPSTGEVTVDCSLDGKLLNLATQSITPYNGDEVVTAYPDNVGKWHLVTISGNYDLQYLEFRGTIAGRR